MEPAPQLVSPLFIPLLASAIFHSGVSASALRSYARLYALAWANAYQYTAPLDFDTQLLPLLGIGRSQALRQMGQLRRAGLLEWSSDGKNRYVLRFPALFESHFPDSVVGVVHKPLSLSESIQQPTTASQKSPTPRGKGALPANPAPPGQPAPSREGSRPSPVIPPIRQGNMPILARDLLASQGLNKLLAPSPTYQTAKDWLELAGVWHDAAERLARQLAANELRSQQRIEARLPGLADVVGWMYYCFADQKKNKIAQPAAVLAANLQANRRCPDEYRPPWVCKTCRRLEEGCRCAEGGDLHLPFAFVEAALHPKSPYAYDLERHSLWGYCLRCKTVPCRCEEED